MLLLLADAQSPDNSGSSNADKQGDAGCYPVHGGDGNSNNADSGDENSMAEASSQDNEAASRW